MSQSPETSGAHADRVEVYQQGWRALSRMISQGRSFSGHERNCCFLNLGNGQFADVSAATELDFLDDSRAVAVVDWDFDGRLDFWLTNRTAPRVRFLHNATQNDGHFLAIRLEGVTCNRDAIGARIELFLSDSPNRALVQQLSAGDGYLAQSSKWIHFGIAAGEKIDRLLVHWPGGSKETFRALQPDGHYRLVQGSALAQPWIPPRIARFNRLPDATPSRDDSLHRTVIVGKVPLPHSQYLDWQGNRVLLRSKGSAPFSETLGKPLLVNLWSPSCLPCLKELSEWTQEAERLNRSGLEIVALCVDSLLESNSAQLVRAKQTLNTMGFPWPSGSAQRQTVQTLELMHHTFVEFKQDLPLPSSFLLDSSGRLAVIYKGRVPVTTLLDDVALLDADRGARRVSALPFPGRWASKPFSADPEPIVRNLDKLGRTGDAVDYARRSIVSMRDRSAMTASTVERRDTLINLHGVLGELLLKQGERQNARTAFDRALKLGENASAIHRDIGLAYMAHNMPAEALGHLASALRGQPDDADLLYNLGIAELATRQATCAIKHLRQSNELNPNDADVCFQLANSLHATGRTREALEHYRRALQIRPGWSFAMNNLAWILATHHDASLRDGRESVRLAEALCKANDRSDASSLATLAAAYAEVGRFKDAEQTNQRAAKLAESRGQQVMAKRLRARSADFRGGQPIRE